MGRQNAKSVFGVPLVSLETRKPHLQLPFTHFLSGRPKNVTKRFLPHQNGNQTPKVMIKSETENSGSDPGPPVERLE